MKKIFPIAFLIAYLTFASFLLGFSVFQQPRIKNTTQMPLPTPCPPDNRVATSKWRTFTTSDYPKFSVDYPEVLIPYTQSRFINVSFRTKTNRYSNAPLGVDIAVFLETTWKGEYRVSGIRNYQCIGAPSTSVYLFHGSKVYLISVIGMSLTDVERMMNSIKYFD